MKRQLIKYSFAFGLGMGVPYSIKMRHQIHHQYLSLTSPAPAPFSFPSWLAHGHTLQDISTQFNSFQDNLSHKMANKCLVNDGFLKQIQGYNSFNVFLSEQEYEKLESNDPISRFYAVINGKVLMQGHTGIVHGGATMTLVEHLLNKLYCFSRKQDHLHTLKQKSSFKKPIFCDQNYVLEADITNNGQIIGRFLNEEQQLVFQMELLIDKNKE